MLAAALALPAQTGAGTTSSMPFAGKLTGGGSVKFDLQQPAGAGYEVVNFRWNNLRIKCNNGKHKHDGGFPKAKMPVDAKTHYFEFEGLRSDGRGGAKVNGTFDETYGSATGQLKVWGRTGWGGRCRSGWVDWNAQPVKPTR